MAKDLNRCIFQRAHTVAQQVHEKTLILTNYKVNTSNKTTIGITSHLLKWLLSKRQADISWQGCEKKKGTSCTISGDANWHNLYGKWVRKFLRKLKVKITFYILTLSLYIYRVYIWRKWNHYLWEISAPPMFTATLLTKPRSGNTLRVYQPRIV